MPKTISTESKSFPRVTCVMPVFNGQAYLAAAVSSVLQQDFTDFELLIVDDGSTDGSLAIAAEFATQDRRVVVVPMQRGGIVKALNAGIAAARGEYLARMDADDICEPARFREQVAYLDQHPDVILVGCVVRLMNSSGQPGALDRGTVHATTRLDRFPPNVSTVVHPTMMVRLDTLRQAGGYSPDYKHAEDYELWIRLSAFGRFVVLPAPLLKYRVHSGSVSVSKMKRQEWSAVRAEVFYVREYTHHALKIGRQSIAGYWKLRLAKRNLVLNKKKSRKLSVEALYFIVKGSMRTSALTSISLLLRCLKTWTKAL